MQVSQRWYIWNNGSDKPYVNAHGTMEGRPSVIYYILNFIFILNKSILNYI